MGQREVENEGASSSEPIPRGILPTYVTDELLVLCKGSARIRNTYEIRLALYFALTRGRQFILVVPSGAEVDPALREHLARFGGAIEENGAEDYSVYVGHELAGGEEGDGWVLGNSSGWRAFRGSLSSPWLRENLVIGACFGGNDIERLRKEFAGEGTSETNVDGENIIEALRNLIESACTDGGVIFIQ